MTEKEYNNVIDFLKVVIACSEYDGHVYAVGGCCRDYLMHRPIKDIDLVVDIANGGIRFAKWLFANNYLTREPVVYEHFGTAMFHLKEFPDLELEAVQTRREAYRDLETRNPETAFGTIEDDCTRRDFTYNAIYHNITNGAFCDYNGKSFTDLNNNILRTCGEPDVIFFEDPLRILRAIRFTCRFDSKIEDATFEGMKKYVGRLEIISKERIQEEFSKMMTSGNADIAAKLIGEIGAWKYILGNSEYSTEGIKYSLENLKKIPDSDYKNLEVNLAIVYSHIGGYETPMKYLKYSNEIIEKVRFYLDMFDEINFTILSPSNIRRLQHMSGSFDNLFNSCTIVYAVYFTSSYNRKVSKIIADTKSMIFNGTAMFGYKLPVDGNDVMAIKSIPPSSEVKTCLDFLMKQAYVNPYLTKKDCETILKCN